MKILLTGGATGGHFYPLIAVTEEIHEIVKEDRLLPPDIYYLAPTPYNSKALFDNGIQYRKVSAGKIRRYFSPLNILDIFKTGWGILKAVVEVFKIYPDVIFSKGGYASFPSVLAGRIFRIPIVIHESDSAPGRVNKWAGRFAEKVAVSYEEAGVFFPSNKVAYTGNPIRKEVLIPLKNGAYEFLNLNPQLPTILILGGSQGSQKINEAVVDALPQLVEVCQIIHQTGKANLEEIKNTAAVVLENNPNKDRYKPFDYLNDLAMRMAAGAADLVVSRAGSTIFEIAAWGSPSIIIPIPESISHDQVKNAFNYARTGSCIVMEEENLTSNILASEIKRLLSNPKERAIMSEKAKNVAKTDAAQKIARQLLDIALKHE